MLNLAFGLPEKTEVEKNSSPFLLAVLDFF
jgi:hypothetical protein